VQIYARTGTPAEIQDERVKHAAEMKQREENAKQQKNLRRYINAVHEMDNKIDGCNECREMRMDCYRGNVPLYWKAVRFTCDQGFADCLTSKGWTVARCSP
jgi:hypothetical protein